VSIATGVIAALLIGTGLVLQQNAAEQAPKAYFLRVRLILELLRKPRWLAGIVVMVAGQVLSAWTLGHLSLSLAEPLLATQLLFALVIAVPLSGVRPQKSEILGAILLSGGVGALSAARTVNAGGERFGSAAYWPAAAAIGVVALLLVRAGLHRPGQQRATLTGLASGLCFGISDALTRNTLLIVDHHGLLAVLTTWPAYSLAAAALCAVWLMENSFSAAPLHASLPAITAAEPVAGILLGVIIFGDAIRISPGMLALQAAGIAALIVGVILVARAPALSSLRAPVLHRTAASRPGKRPERAPAPLPAASSPGKAARFTGIWSAKPPSGPGNGRPRGKAIVPPHETPERLGNAGPD
jgi:drug/metabolite transporter (DMT)-like permease